MVKLIIRDYLKGVLKMNAIELKRILEDKIKTDDIISQYDRDSDKLRFEWKDSKEGMSVSLPQVIGKYEQIGDKAIEDVVNHIKQAMQMMNQSYTLDGMEKHILPVIRSTSFPTETKNGKKLVYKDHTAETRIFYAIDLGQTYRLVEESLLKDKWTEAVVHEHALFNLKGLSVDYKTDEVSGNIFYFVSTQDGYDASRILNTQFLKEMADKCQGDMALAVPHQDVCIIADIRNDIGYDVLAQITLQFFGDGRIPITALPFIYEDDKLDPIFILARKGKNVSKKK